MQGRDSYWEEIYEDVFIHGKELQGVISCLPGHIDGSRSRNHLCKLWDGVFLWTNEIYDRYIDYTGYDIYHRNFAAMNLCLNGRCEVELESKFYIYMTPGVLSVNINEPKKGFSYPGSLYEGIEIAFDTGLLSKEEPSALSAFGLTLSYLNEVLDRGNGSFLAEVTEDTMRQGAELYHALTDQSMSVEDYRFLAVSLLYSLKNGAATQRKNMRFATSGQRRIANEVENTITSDYRKHHTTAELADKYGISASALKKYFEMVYGAPISFYLKKKRMDEAKRLLAETDLHVRDISEHCGYENQGKFGAAFKSYTGILPLEYRRQHYRRSREETL